MNLLKNKIDEKNVTAVRLLKLACLLPAAAFLFSAVSCSRGESAPPQGKNVVMIVVEALPAKKLGCYGSEEGLTPGLDTFAKSGMVFQRFYAAGPWTMPSFGTLLTGLPPAIHRAGRFVPHPVDPTKANNQFFGLRDNIPYLPKLLHGVETGAIINNIFLHSDFGFARDWGTYDFQEAGFDKYRDAATVTDTALDWLKKKKDKSSFLLVHYFDPHLPYVAPEAFIQHFKCGDMGRVDMSNIGFLMKMRTREFWPDIEEQAALRCRHNAEIAYADKEIKRLIDTMDARGLSDNTWVVVTADHGEELFEHDGFEHGHRYEDELTRVPLIIRAPGAKWHGGTRVKFSARHIDIAPTVLGWFGKPVPSEMEGRSLLRLVTGEEKTHRTAYMSFNLVGVLSYALFDGRYKIIETMDRSNAFMYDLDADPEEKKKLGPENAHFKRLQTEMRAIHDKYEKAGKDAYLQKEKSPAVSRENMDALRSLGYIE